MQTLPKHPDEVKHIISAVDPNTEKFAVYLSTAHALITIPVATGTIPLFTLFYRPQEVDLLYAYVHESGLVAYFPGDSTVWLPIKDLHGWPLPRSKPGDFQTAIADFDHPLNFHHIGATDILILLWRPLQPGEISQQDIDLLKRAFRVRQQKAQDPDPHDQVHRSAQAPDRHLHIVPPREPGTMTASPELQISLSKIPVPALTWPLSLGLPFGASVLYLIIRHFPARSRQSTEKQYSDTGAKQLLEYMILFLPYLLRNVPDEWRDQAKALKPTIHAVEKWHVNLRDIGLVVPVSPPKPGVRTSRRLAARNEKERRENQPLARRVRKNPRQPHKALLP